MTKYTPGPWIAKQRSWGYPKHEGGPIIRAWDVFSETGVPIAGGTITEENEANARLIAAAPQLAEALKAVRDFAQPEILRGPASVEWVRSMDLVEAALKAAGIEP